jgi:hypothetical protein
MNYSPLAHSIAAASARSGLGRTSIYGLINDGLLPAHKCGTRTIILDLDLQRCLEALPAVPVKRNQNQVEDKS